MKAIKIIAVVLSALVLILTIVFMLSTFGATRITLNSVDQINDTVDRQINLQKFLSIVEQDDVLLSDVPKSAETKETADIITDRLEEGMDLFNANDFSDAGLLKYMDEVMAMCYNTYFPTRQMVILGDETVLNDLIESRDNVISMLEEMIAYTSAQIDVQQDGLTNGVNVSTIMSIVLMIMVGVFSVAELVLVILIKPRERNEYR